MGVEWFGMPDDRKHHNAGCDSKLKGMTNDRLRNATLKAVVPAYANHFHVDAGAPSNPKPGGGLGLEYGFPCEWDADDRVWLYDQPITWDQVWERWRARGR